MDRESSELQDRIFQSQDEPEFGFEDTFPPVELQPPIPGLPDTQHGSFDSLLGGSGVSRLAVGGHSAPLVVGRMTSLGSGSFGQKPRSNLNWGGSSNYSSSSLPQTRPLRVGQRPSHMSPMLHPLSSTDTFFPELSGTSVSGHSTNDVMADFWPDSSSWTAQESHGQAMPMFEPSSKFDQMSDEELQYFFHGPHVVHAIAESPRVQAHEASSGYGTMPMDISHDVPRDLSPVSLSGDVLMQMQPDQIYLDSSFGSSVSAGVSPVLGPNSSSFDSNSMLDFPMLTENLSAHPSPALQPRDKAGRKNSPATNFQVNFVTVEPGQPHGRPTSVRNNSKKVTGRKGPLASIARVKAARMRQVGVCSACKKRKSSCDAELYCKSCIRHFGVAVIHSPCRGRILSDLAQDFIQAGIFPTARTLESFLGSQYNLTAQLFNVRLKFGFGHAITVQVRAVVPKSCAKEHLRHNHLVYQWPLRARQVTERRKCYHQVFPAVLATTVGLKAVLHQHLGRLVDDCFDDFPHHRSQLKVLRPFYKYYKSLGGEDEPRKLIKEAFKLLVLVHIGGDLQMDATDDTSKAIVRRFFGLTGEGSCPDTFSTCPKDIGNFPTPCFIRGQLGMLMPELANEMMVDILRRIEKMSLGQKCDMWPPAIVTFGIILMAVESIDYHKQKVGFHVNLETDMVRSQSEPSRPIPCGPQARPGSPPGADAPSVGASASDHACDQLVGFYRACFPNCHGRLARDLPSHKHSGSSAASQQEAQNTLIAELRSALSSASDYLAEKKGAAGQAKDDLSSCFDRRLAHFFVPNVEVAF